MQKYRKYLTHSITMLHYIHTHNRQDKQAFLNITNTTEWKESLQIYVRIFYGW